MRSGTGYWSPTMLSAHSCTRLSGSRHAASAGSCRFVPAIWRRYVIVLFQEGFEARGNAFFSGMPAIPRQIHDAAALFQAEASQQEEGFAWSGCNPVGVAAPCVQHGTGGFLQTLVCHVYQAVLQFERTDRFHFLSKVLIHKLKFRFVIYCFQSFGE